MTIRPIGLHSERNRTRDIPNDGHRPSRARRLSVLAIILSLGGLLMPLSANAAPSRPNLYRVPASIDRSGSTNVSVPLQAFIDSVPDRSTIAFPAGATYLLGGNGIKLDGRRKLFFAGHGAKLKVVGCRDATNSAFVIGLGNPSSRITIRNFVIAGNNPNGGTPLSFSGSCEYQHGVAIYRSTHVRIDRMQMRRLFGDCVYVGGTGDPLRWSAHVRFTDSVCASNGRQGVAVVAGRDVRVKRVAFDKISIVVFDLEPNTAQGGARNVVFANNRVGTYGHSRQFGGYLFGATGSLAAIISNVTVRDNVVTQRSIKSIVGDGFDYRGGRTRRNIAITGNRSRIADWGPVLRFIHADGVIVRGNQQPLKSGPLVSFKDSVNYSVAQE